MISAQIVKGLVEHFDQIETTGLQSLEIRKEDMALLKAQSPWTSEHRRKARTTLELLTYASIDLAGLPRFAVPAEYSAAVIYNFVSMVNWQVACHVISAGRTAAEDIESEHEPEDVTPRKLFALICECAGQSENFKAKLQKKVRKSVERDNAAA